MLILEFSMIPPIFAGIWCGNGKPPLSEYLNPIISELAELISNGIVVVGHTIKVQLGFIACDTPARAYVKGITRF